MKTAERLYRANMSQHAAGIVNYRLRTVTLKLAEPPTVRIGSPEYAVSFLRSIYAELDGDREHFVMLALDTQNGVRGYKVIATGGQSASLVDPKTLFRDALLLGAAAIVVAHNHPSGDPTSSREDLRLTRQLSEAGKLLDLRVHDHIILGEGNKYVSLNACGQMS